MKIAMLLNNLQGGGGERAHVMLANGLAAIGHQVELIVVKREGPCDELIAPEVVITELAAQRAVFAVPSLIAALKRSRPDILVSAMVIANVVAALAGIAIPHLPMIAIDHGDMNEVYHVDRGALAARVGYLLSGHVYGRFDRVYCVDQSTAISASNFMRRADLPIRVMPNAIIGADADARARAEAQHPWLADTTTPLFVNVGRMARQKNQSLLLRSFARVKAERDTKMIILGQGPLLAELEAERDALGLSDSVDFPGFLDPFPFLARAAAFVLTSRWEALPTVIVEALYCGCPTIVTKASIGTLELVGYGRWGRIVNTPSADSIAAEMLAALDDVPDRSALRAEGSKYTIEEVAKIYEQDFQSVLQSRKLKM